MLQIPRFNECTALHLAMAAPKGQYECAKLLIQACPQSTKAFDTNGQSALHYATQSVDLDIKAVELLLEAEADPGHTVSSLKPFLLLPIDVCIHQ